jgi:flagella basal body P-ring formation protein FlgA
MRRLFFLLALFAAGSLAAQDASRPVGPFTQEMLATALNRELMSHFNLEGDLQLELLRDWNPSSHVAANWQVVVTEYPSVVASAMLLRCRVLADGVPSGEATLTVRANLWRDAWVARQPLLNGATFDPALLETRRVDLFRERDALPATVGDQTFVIARAVNTGRVVTWRDIARRPLVKKGDVVEVTASEGMLSVTMKAMALQNGGQGEAVTFRNLESRKDFTAFVIDENRAQVRF